MTVLKQLADLSGRVALVTGGAGGLGTMICETFAQLGASVAVVDREDSDACGLAERLADAFDVAAVPVACDLEDVGSVAEVVHEVADALSGIDIVVNCAAFNGMTDLDGWIGPVEQQSVETWRRALDVNLTAPFVLSQAALPYLYQHDRGVIVNVSSIYGSLGPDHRLYEGLTMGNPAAYAASKGGLEQLTRWLATSLAPRVRVNAVAPGGVLRQQPTAFIERYSERTPMGRMATEADLMGTFVYLATDLSRYVTGQVIRVDGGWSAW